MSDSDDNFVVVSDENKISDESDMNNEERDETTAFGAESNVSSQDNPENSASTSAEAPSMTS